MTKKRKIQISEYGTVVIPDLTESTVNCLFDIAENLSKHYNSSIINVSKDRQGNIKLVASSFVGVVDVSDELALEIIPKIYAGDSSINMKNLFFMLNYSGRFDLPLNQPSSLEKYNGSFFEILIHMYAMSLLTELKRSPFHKYIRDIENRPYLRGRLVLSEHLRRNNPITSRFYTETDEFTINNMLNQTFKFVAQGLYSETREKGNKKLLRRALSYLDGVDNIRPSIGKLDRIRLDRLSLRFAYPLELSKMFIRNQSFVSKSGRGDSWTILVDMNVLYEEFVAKSLTKGLMDRGSLLSVKTQGPVGYFVKNINDDRELFATRPDISILDQNIVKIIIDTKYKLLSNHDSKHGVSQQDLYQMFAYARRYSVNDIILLYPELNSVTPHTLELPDGVRVYIKTINLNRDIKKDILAIESEVAQMLLGATPTD